MRILLAYDGTHGAENALDDLGRAALTESPEILILTVAEHALAAVATANDLLPAMGEAEPGPRPPTEREAAAAERALGVCRHGVARAREICPGARVEGLVCGGSRATAILLHADAWMPDLVIVGPRGRPRAVRAVLGSVARRVVTEARCSVRVARASTRTSRDPARILVGHDGSAGGGTALTVAASRAWRAGSEILVLGVSPPDVVSVFANTLEASAPWPIAEPPTDRTTFAAAIETDAARVRRTGLAITTLLRLGDVAATLLRNARSWKADTIFVGATSMSRADRFLLGSVSAAVADRALCSVEVVRPLTRAPGPAA